MTATPRPLIGITSGFTPRESDPDRGRGGIEQEYADAVLAAGGLPTALPLPPPDRVDEYVATFDGFVFTGGLDIPPDRYGAAEVHEKTKPMPPRRLEWDLALVRAVVEAGRPMLAVCLGLQELNIAFGGSLHQHLDTGIRHARDESGHARHQVELLEPAKRLRAALGTDRLETNSSHHQSVDRVGDGLQIVARAPDGTVESLEPIDGTGFVLAVQWHPERIIDEPGQLGLFEALVAAARIPRGGRH